MSAQLSPIPVMRFYDNNNNPLAGGQLFTYQAGTTTPVATYTDSTASTANTNPVILNARGEAAVWLNPTQAYKFILEDASGNTIWTADQITAPAPVAVGNLTDENGSGGTPGFAANVDFTPGTTTSLTLSKNYGSASNLWVAFDAGEQGADTYSLSGTTLTFTSPIPVGINKVYVKGGTTLSVGTPGAGSITDNSVAANAGIQSSKLSYNQGGTGAVTRTIQQRLQDIVSVKDFGAKGDGTTDDTASFQAAMNWLGTNGGELYLPPGTYIINSSGSAPLTWGSSTSTLRVRGAGRESTFLKCTNTANASVFNITTGTGFELSDLTLSGPTTATATGGFLLTDAIDHKFDRVGFVRYFGAANMSANVGIFNDCALGAEGVNGPMSTSSSGIVVNGYAGGLNITNCVGFVPTNPTLTPFCGINLQNCGAVQITGCNIIRQGTNVLVNPQNGQTVASLMISNCYLDSAQNYNLQLVPGAGGTVVRTYVTQTECSSALQSGIQLDGRAGIVDGVLIISAQANFCTLNGITAIGANAKNIDIVGGSLVQSLGSGLSVNSGASVRAVGVFAGGGYGGGGNAIGFFCDSSSALHLKACAASGNTSADYSIQPSTIVQNCDGFISANSGSSAVAASTTAIVVNHGLSGTPGASNISLTPNVAVGSNAPFVDTTSITASQFTVRTQSAPAGALNFSWRATCNGQQ